MSEKIAEKIIKDALKDSFETGENLEYYEDKTNDDVVLKNQDADWENQENFFDGALNAYNLLRKEYNEVLEENANLSKRVNDLEQENLELHAKIGIIKQTGIDLGSFFDS